METRNRLWLSILALAALVTLFVWLRRGSEREFDALAPIADETEPRTEPQTPFPTERESVPVDPSESAEPASTEEPIAAITFNNARGYEPLDPPGFAELEVLVLVDDLPASRVNVEVVPITSHHAFTWPGLEPIESATRIQATGGDGIARFPELTLGSKTVQVTSPGGTIVTRVSDDLESGKSRRVVFAFGSARIFGTVYGDDGVPAARDTVLILCEPRDGAANWRAEIRTDERGSYSVEGLAPAFFKLVSVLSQTTRSSAGHRARIELALGEQRRVDLGSPYPLARCSGTVRFPDGRALAQPMTMWVYEKSRGWRIEFACDASGAFDFELPRGEYQIFTYGRPQPIELGVLDVTSARIESDITLPLPIVFGTANWSNDPSPVERRQVVFEPRSGDSSTLVNIENGTFCAFALPAGDYLVYVYKTKLLGHPPEGFELRVDPLATIELELSLLR